jgi:hypothetical protein
LTGDVSLSTFLGKGIEGFVMTEQLQAFDLHARRVDLVGIVGRLDEATLATVITYLKHFFW